MCTRDNKYSMITYKDSQLISMFAKATNIMPMPISKCKVYNPKSMVFFKKTKILKKPKKALKKALKKQIKMSIKKPKKAIKHKKAKKDIKAHKRTIKKSRIITKLKKS